jgi:hypothetical protein
MQGPNTSGKNYGSLLPKVGAGTPISYDHINRLSEAVARNQINTVNGGIVKRTNSGTSIVPVVSDDTTPPWSVTLTDTTVYVKIGNVWGSAIKMEDVKKFISPYEETGAPTKVPCPVDVVCNIAGKEFTDTDPYYVSFPRGSSLPQVIHLDISGSKPEIKMDPLVTYTPSFFSIPIAATTQESFVVQIVKGDIWLRTPVKPLQVSVNSYYEGTDLKWKATISAGLVNNTVPVYPPNDPITDTSKFINFTPSSTIYFYLDVEGEPEPAPFPTKVTFTASNVALNDGLTSGFVLAALANFSFVGGAPKLLGVSNFLSGSIRAEAHKYTATSVKYFFYYI